MSLVQVHNEWDPLEEILVGSPLHAALPLVDKGFEVIQQTSPDLFNALKPGPIPKKIIEETEEDILIFIDALQKAGICVRRPEPVEFKTTFRTLDWEANHYFSYCPRDILLAVGEMIIESPNVFRSRYFETIGYKNILIEYMKSGSKWITAPKPRLLDDIYNISDPNQSALLDLEPVFDAANILRAGKDILYLVSDSGNELGCLWLQTILGKQYRVHPCHNLYASMHIDTTISLLRPGLVLINPTRVREDNLPQFLKNWDLLICPEMVNYSYSDLAPASTPWLGMNLLMLNPHLAIVDQHQLPLIRLLEENDIQVIPALLRHGRTLGGGFHCITLDVRRKGKLENYA
ncbi:MAG: inosamine-phosphate amidinotransferase 1 [Gammaproteobacteria bacterium]|nr:inosamine-phosphate amidinotransferase 1 [Gammaproteobacteria bacterium]